jgi:hypothetical protein
MQRCLPPVRPLLLALLAACNGGGNAPTEPTTPTPTPPPTTPVPDPVAPAAPLPDQAPVTTELAGDHACGTFSSKDFTKTDVPMLGDRFRVRFLASPKVEGDNASQRAAVSRGAATAFVGARELFVQGDATFARHATKRATFDGGYDPITVPAQNGVSIVAGLLKAAPGNEELVAVAHGWFLDANKDVLDVAVFVSHVTDANLAACRKFAQKVLATVSPGPKQLAWGTGAAVETKVSYATFSYVLPADWILASNLGIHDFARVTFRHRGTYPDGFTSLQLGLDSHPGDWSSPGNPDGTRKGKLLGLDVVWNQTKDTGAGAWTISKDVRNRDHAVASITSGSAAGRDAAIKFAESIVAK